MSIRTLAARGLSFAHLAGFGNRASRAEDDKPEDEDKPGARGAEDDDKEPRDREDGDGNGSKGKKGKKAEDDKDPDAEDDELDEDEDDKKARRAENDDADPDAEDDEDEMRGKSAVARARIREQARCAAIMGSKAAGRNVELAANLAFKTRMTRQEALAILRTSPGALSASQERSSRNPRLGAGAESQRSSSQAAAAGWDRAFSKTTGKRQ
ncbi:hypothetical protein AB4Z27_27010 [Cupriavidus sp. KB_39]|uniref:hypothetical protein n=1 Tax=Cupriavidus sp. KB_39 TaxID=3233036 RepID=UPI003F91A55C